MKSYLKVITNIFLTSISLSVLVGSLLKITGPIYQRNKANQRIDLVREQKKSIDKKTNLLLFYNNNSGGFKRLEQLISKWENLIVKNPGLEVSCFFFSLDNQMYAEIKPEAELPAASSIKVPIFIVLLSMLDRGELHWDEKLILTEDTIGSGAGWMAYEEIGKEFPVYEIASEMIRVSDNTATNILIKRLGGISIINQKFKEIGLKNTKIKNLLPDLNGTNVTSAKDLSIAMALVDSGHLLTAESRDIFREIMQRSKTNTLIPNGILKGLGEQKENSDYHLALKGYLVHNKTGDIGISYSDTALIQTPQNSRAFASFIVKGPFNDPRSPELIRNLSAELVPFLAKKKKVSNPN